METPMRQALWRKSSYSGQSGNCVEVAAWRKSSFSGGAQSCVEVADSALGAVAVRDSKNPHAPALILTPAAWRALTGRVKDGELSLARKRRPSPWPVATGDPATGTPRRLRA